jgi:hypothetical protein
LSYYIYASPPPQDCSQRLVARLAIGFVEAVVPASYVIMPFQAYLTLKDHIARGTPTIRELYRDEAERGHVALQKDRLAYGRLQRGGGSTYILRFLRRCQGGHTTEYPQCVDGCCAPDRCWTRQQANTTFYAVVKTSTFCSLGAQDCEHYTAWLEHQTPLYTPGRRGFCICTL